MSLDVITYAGQISTTGYESLCDVLKQKKGSKALLVLATPGGDPHAGFRIARALQHDYESFDALVPRYCKSAGTLILVGATKLYLDDMSELGPLDVQVKKGDELVGRNSGLDIFQAVSYLQNQSLFAFRQYLWSLTREHGLSTKVASDIAVRLATGLIEPIAAQIDPIKLAEMQRATDIANAYGYLLNEKSKNLRTGGMEKLVSGYPSHGFAIDRKEAKSIFIDVDRPTGLMLELSMALRTSMQSNVDAQQPIVELLSLGNEPGDANVQPSLHITGSPEGYGDGSEPSHETSPDEGKCATD